MIDAAGEALLAYSCDKNFGLYRERTGALFAVSKGHIDEVRSNLLALARVNWSMPPDHGAAVVRLILESASLRQQWMDQLTAMRRRIAEVRSSLAVALPNLSMLKDQRGMFALLPLTVAQIARLRTEHAIYMAGSGRINVAGLVQATLPTFVRAFQSCVEEGA